MRDKKGKATRKGKKKKEKRRKEERKKNGEGKEKKGVGGFEMDVAENRQKN